MSSLVPVKIANQVKDVFEFLYKVKALNKSKVENQWKKRGDCEDRDVFNVKALRHYALQSFLVYEVCTHATELHETIYQAPDFVEAAKQMEQNEQYRIDGDDRYKPVVMILKPRGSRKTSTLGAKWHSWCYIRDKILFNKTCITLVGHSDLKKANDNIKEINIRAFDKELIRFLFQDVLDYERKTKDAIRFKDAAQVEGMKEDHFFTGSPEADLAGKHINRWWCDDWVTDKNTMTIEGNDKVKEAFYSVWSLDDHTGGDNMMPIVITCTHYPDDSLYVDLKNSPDVLVFENGVTKDGTSFDPEITTEDNLMYPQWLGMKKLTTYYRNRPRHIFKSQYDMIPYSRNVAGINFEGKLPVWRWGNSALPDPDQVAYKVVLCDPSLSKKNRKSQAVVLVVYVLVDGSIAVVEGFNQTGIRAGALLSKITNAVTRHRANMAIIEAIAYQESLAQQIEEWRSANQYNLVVRRHKHFINKQDHYRAFLEPFLMQERILVNPNITELIRQIYGKSHLDDMVDCLSFISEININAFSRKYENVEPMLDPRSLQGMARLRRQNNYNNNNKKTLGVWGW